MARLNLELLGADELVAKLRAFPEVIEKKIVRQAIRKAVKPIMATAKENAPVDTGKMRDTIRLRALKRRRNRVGFAIITGTREELGIPSDYEWYYPSIVELGDGTGNHPPTRFLRNAMDAHRESALAQLRMDIGRGIEREAAKQAAALAAEAAAGEQGEG